MDISLSSVNDCVSQCDLVSGQCWESNLETWHLSFPVPPQTQMHFHSNLHSSPDISISIPCVPTTMCFTYSAANSHWFALPVKLWVHVAAIFESITKFSKSIFKILHTKLHVSIRNASRSFESIIFPYKKSVFRICGIHIFWCTGAHILSALDCFQPLCVTPFIFCILSSIHLASLSSVQLICSHPVFWLSLAILYLCYSIFVYQFPACLTTYFPGLRFGLTPLCIGTLDLDWKLDFRI